MSSREVFHPSSGLPPDIAEALFDENDDSPGLFGDPPESLKHLHRPRFVDSFWERMVETMLQPAQLDRSLGIRRVQILGQRIFEFADDGTIAARDWGTPPHENASHRPVPAGTVLLGRVPSDDDWIVRFRDGFLFELDCRVDAPPHEHGPYTDWVFGEIVSRIQGHFDLDWMRGQIDAALALDPRAASLAAEAAGRADGLFTALTYNEALQWLRNPVRAGVPGKPRRPKSP